MVTIAEDTKRGTDTINSSTTVGSEKLLNLKESAAYLDMSESGLRKIVDRTRAGRPGSQIQYCQAGRGGRLKFKMEWLDNYVLANSIEPGQIVPAKKHERGRSGKGLRRPVEIDYQWFALA